VAASHIQPALDALPEPLRAPSALAWSEFLKNTGEARAEDLPPPLLSSIPKVWAASPFVAGQCARRPGLLFELADSARLEGSTDADGLRRLLRDALGGNPAEAELMAALRRFRNREMVRIAWRDIAGWAELDETLQDLSLLAEVCVQEALDLLFRQACAVRGTPVDRDGRPQNLVVLAMGKLGAYELNYSSDIDLIFAYRDDGVLPDKRETSYSEFYTRLARGLVKVLDSVTEDGIVFRTDTRLRPFGESGPLVMNFEGMDAYYQSQAREWERYAMVKVRTLAGDFEGGAELENFLQPFVYRRYLDYRALGELRDLKQKISRELQRKDRQENVKLGPGGIREIEFIGQAFQLIRGGPEKRLRDRRIQVVLGRLPELGLMQAEVAQELIACYRYLRTVENRLQQYGDRQTHDLPVAPAERLAIAHALGHGDWESFKAELDAVRERVHAVFQQVVSPALGGEAEPALTGEPGQIAAALAELGWAEGGEAAELLVRFHQSRSIRGLTARGETELRRLLPMLLRAVAGVEEPLLTLERLLGLIEAIASRNVYLTLLAENPPALRQLVKLAAASPWISHTIARYPLLLDELLDPRSLYTPLSKAELAAELERRLASLDPADQEQRMIALRQFKQASVLRVAAADLSGAIPLMVVSDYLTWTAEALVDAILREAWRLTAEKHGVPPGARPDQPDGFAVIAYGKLGGIELGYGSDLDLVFLYDGDPTAPTGGDKPVTTAEFFSRVGKRIIHYVTTNSPSGILYEVDLRLRPSGNSGLLVSHLDAYETYQMNQAWTWEQQALVKARCIAGDPAVGARFAAIREKSLCRARDTESLRAEVREMREKMRDNLGSNDPRLFNVKHDFGGIVDIEFLVQFGVLSRAQGDPGLTRWTDVVRLLDSLAASGFLGADAAGTLRRAYCEFRDKTHRAALQESAAVVPADRWPELRSFVQKAWRDAMETAAR
jgi:glutamate-ammonia-ligase adenylyltransferase